MVYCKQVRGHIRAEPSVPCKHANALAPPQWFQEVVAAREGAAVCEVAHMPSMGHHLAHS
jgi:hypothetical protein